MARLLKGTLPPDIEIAEHDGESASLIALLDGAAHAIFIDACVSGARPGTLHRFDVSSAPLPQAGFSLSTHGLGLAEAIELARALGGLPPRSIVYAIEAASFEMGHALSPAVAAAVGEADEKIRAELDGGGRAVRPAAPPAGPQG